MDLRSERGEATRRQLLEHAIRLFAEHGYENVSIEIVLRDTGVSRGSLYHHYAGKDLLFLAALEATEERIAATVRKATSGIADAREALRVGCDAWLDLATRDQAVRQIALIDAPAVLGWEKWREIDGRFGLGLLNASLRAIAATGTLPKANIEMFAHMLLAILSELALLISRSKDPGTSKEAREALASVLARLFGA